MEFSYREIKFQVRVDCLDVKTKTSKALGKTLLDLRCYISLQDGGHIRLTWLLFDIILLSSRERDGILISRDEIPRDSTCLDEKTKTSKVLRETLLELRCWTSFQDGGHIRLTRPMFDIILFFTR